MSNLNSASLPKGVTLASGHGGLPVLRIHTEAATGEIYLLGAHVTAWTPAGAEAVLWMSEESRFEPGKPIRGGVPVCGPWFGAGKKGNLKPAHGWFRVNNWELTAARVAADGSATCEFRIDGRYSTVPEGQPRGIRATYVVVMGKTLDLSLTVCSDEDLDLEEAVHTYLDISDIKNVTVEGLDTARYVDKAPGGRAVNAQQGALKFLRETDRVYAHEGTVEVVDPGKKRRLTLSKSGSASTVVWNPWSAKAAAMPDFGDDEWTGMVCVETANALQNSVKIPAGRSHTMRAVYGVADL